MPGLELPDIHFPLHTPETIVSEDLEKKLSSQQKQFLINEFLTYPSLISQYSYDVGRLNDYLYGCKIVFPTSLYEKSLQVE